MKSIAGGVCAARAFRASGLACGIKRSKRRDLALIYSEKPCLAAGTFTTNKIQAACVRFNKRQLAHTPMRAILANSGNANCMNGAVGMSYVTQMVKCVSTALDVKPTQVLVGQTGVIGVPLPIKKVLGAIPALVEGLSRKGGTNAALGILTTDHNPKEVAYEFKIGSRTVRMGAIAKGAGMIHPNMILHDEKHATMLCYITTDANISQTALRVALKRAIVDSFHMISIDADQSTNDMVVVLANAAAGNRRIKENTPDFKLFCRVLERICIDMAKLMVQDGEGATKFCEVQVHGASSVQDAKKVVNAIITSKLVKTALFGSDPNWGRIAASVGYSGANVDARKLGIKLGSEVVVRKGSRIACSLTKLNRTFARKNIKVSIDLGLGKHKATGWTCDLSTGYVRINSAYTT